VQPIVGMCVRLFIVTDGVTWFVDLSVGHDCEPRKAVELGLSPFLFCRDVQFSGRCVPRPVVILAGTLVVPFLVLPRAGCT